MELRYRREASVGLLLVLGVAAFYLLLMWLQGKSFKKADLVHAQFETVAGLKEGDPVRVSGVRVGNVKSILLAGHGNVDVMFDVEHGQEPREDARIQIVAADFFGARYIEYTPGTSERPLAPTAVLHGQRMDDLSGMATSLSEQGRGLLGDAATTARQLNIALINVNRLLTTLNSGSQAATENLVGALEALRRSLQRVDQMVEQSAPAAGQAMRNLQTTSAHADSLMRSLQHTSASMDSLLAKASNGRGALPTLLNDTSVVAQLMQTNAALRDLLIDFKANPGRYIRFRL